jgi:phosphoribosylformimino-5-aminoimidazole carboxamide ribotide isomerase
MLLIPSIDLRGGQSVRLLRGDFAHETRYAMTPTQLLQRYRALGAPWLHVVDLDGARDGKLANRVVIQALCDQQQVKIQVGGGVRSAAVIDDLLQLGVQRVVLGSAAAEQPQLTAQWLNVHGGERICIAFDVKVDAGGLPRIYTRGWTQETPLILWDAAQQYVASGLRHVLCTDIDRDGALGGPNIELYHEARRRFPQIQWQASGGVRHAADLAALAEAGCAAAISGKAMLEERIATEELQPFLSGASTDASRKLC